MFLNQSFCLFWTNAQEYDCWIIWQLHFQFFKEPPYYFPQWLYQFTFLAAVQEVFLFSTSSPAFIICRHFDNDHSDQCEVMPHCCFGLLFSNNQQHGVFLHVPPGHLYAFFGESSVSVFCPLFDLVAYFIIVIFLLTCMSSLCVLEINPLLVTSFANIFFHSIGCLFTLLMVSSAVKLPVYLMTQITFLLF